MGGKRGRLWQLAVSIPVTQGEESKMQPADGERESGGEIRWEVCEKKETFEGSLREALPSFYERDFSLLFLHSDDIVCYCCKAST